MLAFVVRRVVQAAMVMLTVDVPYFVFDLRLCADRGAAAHCERSR
ncbi:MAG: hypothetical protein OZ924_05970 [Burkholderiaceae bacterium]|jgi:hypothetical protein|nr:hypothetical protein [Burkholderiaceae bacterium]